MRRLHHALAAGSIALCAPVASAAAQCLAGSSPNFDFVTAPRILFESDFTREAIGDFPEDLEFKSGAMEVSEWQGLRALKASSRSALVIPLAEALPERFTLELGLVHRNTQAIGAWTVKIYGGRAQLSDFETEASRVNIGHDAWQIIGGGASGDGELAPDGSDDCVGQEMQVRMTVDGPKIKVYADERRLASIPNANFLRARGLVLALEGNDDGDNAVYLTHIRLAGAGGAERPMSIASKRAQSAPAQPETNLPITVRPAPDANLPITVQPAPEPATSSVQSPSVLEREAVAQRADSRSSQSQVGQGAAGRSETMVNAGGMRARGIEDGPTSGPPPVSLEMTPYNPVFHQLTWDWDRVNGWSHFQVHKRDMGTWQLMRDQLKSMAYYDSALVSPGTSYRVVVVYPDGRAGSADIVYANPPQPQAPTGFMGKQISTGTVKLAWQNSPAATAYRVYGPNLPADGAVASTTTLQVSGLPTATHTFSVVSEYRGIYETSAATMTHVAVRPTSGNYRVVFLGAKALNESSDDPLEFDGKRDEVYAAAFWATVPYYHVAGTPITASGIVKSMTYGDVNNIPNRLQAGSASARGGIRTGDAVGYGSAPAPGAPAHADRFPLLVWEGTLADSSEALVIAATIWEWDGNASPNYAGWTSWWSSPNGRAGVRDAASAERPKPGVGAVRLNYTEESTGFVFGPGATVNQGLDRPIGIARNSTTYSTGWWVPFGPVITREKLEAALGSTQAVTITITASDALYLDGRYELYLQFERR